MKFFAGLIFFLFVFKANAIDLTITLTAIPANTPEGHFIYISGNFNNWATERFSNILHVQSNGNRQIVLKDVSGIIEFKFNRGTWETAEGTAKREFIPNRTYNTANGSKLNLTIEGWEDLSASKVSTANANVQILSNDFKIPLLNRNRKIWLYLPNDYATATNKNYPVIYMHDGQNLFDQNTSFSGEWKVDETLNSLQNQGNQGAIVVGIENGESERLNEYSPWINSKYGGGQGDAYIDFIKNTLKPYIDSNFRTKKDAENTGLFGSSMGALISIYGAAKYPETFGKVGVFSPSVWFAKIEVLNFIKSKNFKKTPLRLYFLAGTNESPTMVKDMKSVRKVFLSKGVSVKEVKILTHSDGAHSEWYWAREFGEAFTFLFPETISNK
jgi:predicted alpha/beta superfamily hydrolase